MYCVFIVLWFLSNRLLQDSWWGLVVLDKYAGYFLFGSIPVVVLALLSRKKSWILTASIPLLVCAYFYLPFILPISTSKPLPDTGNLRIATFNIWNHNEDIEAVVALINEVNSDVIAIQEVTDVQRLELISLLSTTYPHYHVSKPVYGGTTALFSRHEMYNVVELEFDIDRPAIVADFDWQGHKVSLVSAHLNPSFWAYHQQPWRKIPANFHQYIKDQNTQALMIINTQKNRAASDAYFIACDCNSQETASTNRLFNSVFSDTLKTIGWQTGVPMDENLRYEHNLLHIDYIWHSGNAKPSALYRTKNSAGSDHDQIVADFSLK